MVTKRDQDILNFLEEFHAATSGQIHKLFFTGTSYRYSRKRLQYISEQGFVKRTRSTINNDNAYYIKKPSLLQQLHHDLIRTELYTAIRSKYELLSWANEVPVGNIRPDALAYVQHSGIVFPLMIEIHLSNGFDFDKYKQDFKPYFGINPRVVICTDREIKPSVLPVKFKVVTLDMSGLDSLIK